MRRLRPTSTRPASRKTRARSTRPVGEALEGRILLYSTIGQWTYSSRITYSFMPDGTSVGGVPSALFQTLNAIAPTTTWQNAIEQAATVWEANANVNLALVSDNGEPVGSNGDQQDDPNIGDIRIGAAPLGSNVLAETFFPPPSNGGTLAGDILFNTQVTGWGIGHGYDVATVAAHEFGHALGLGESTVTNAVMYGSYNGINTTLVSDDISGIQSLYGAPQYDQFNVGGHRNTNFMTATNINSYIDGNGQIAIPNLANTTGGTSEWYSVTVPASNSGTMSVTVQSITRSSFAPTMYIFNSSLGTVATAATPTNYGSELSLAVPVSAGQKYYVKVLATGSYGQVGAYGLLLNFGSVSQPMIPPPNTLVLQQPGTGGGTENSITTTTGNTSSLGGSGGVGSQNPVASWSAIGNLAGWASTYTFVASGTEPTSGGPPIAPVSPPTAPPVIAVPITAAPIASPAPRPLRSRRTRRPAPPRRRAAPRRPRSTITSRSIMRWTPPCRGGRATANGPG